MDWQKRATPRGRSWWVLVMSERRIEETESGSWPTAKASDGRTKGTGGTADRGLDAMARAGLMDWQTPTVADVTGGHKTRSGTRKNELLLNGQVQEANWVTPQARDGENRGVQSMRERVAQGHSMSLPEQVKDLPESAWPTPAARDWKDTGHEPSANERKSPCLPATVMRESAWPTPAAMNPNDGEGVETWLARRERLKQTQQNGNGCGTPLSIAVQLESASARPTPTATDAKASGAAGYSTASGRHSGTTLTDATVGPRGPESRSTSGKSRARLNHRWVAQLLGFPSDWLDGIAEQA